MNCTHKEQENLTWWLEYSNVVLALGVIALNKSK